MLRVGWLIFTFFVKTDVEKNDVLTFDKENDMQYHLKKQNTLVFLKIYKILNKRKSTAFKIIFQTYK